MTISVTIAKIAGAFVLSSVFTGCATLGGVNINENQARTMGGAACSVLGGAAGAALGKTDNPITQAIGAALGGFGGYQFCGAAAEAIAANKGSCDRQIVVDNRTGQVVSDRSNCKNQHGMPVGTPQVIYR